MKPYSFFFQDGIQACINICLCSFFSLFGNKLRSLRLHKHQFAPFEIYDDDALDNFIRGLITQPSQEMDSSFDKEVSFNMAYRNNLISTGNKTWLELQLQNTVIVCQWIFDSLFKK